ncbi:MAG: efflux RND transporter permease subunit [Sneathiella sp.]
MNLAKIAIENAKITYFITFLIIVGGVGAFFNLGQLEDPEFTIKTAVIATSYPGASAKEVELEVTDKIELAIQEMAQIDYLESFSRAGYSQISVNIKPKYTAEAIPQVWDELRRKVREVENSLPPGAGRPTIGDDFGDVFGFQLAVVGDGFSYNELQTYTKEIKKHISVVEGVARVDLWGEQQKAVYLDISKAQLTQLGISIQTLAAAVQNLGLVTDAGSVNLTSERMRIAPTGELQTIEDIGNIVITPSAIDLLQNKGSSADTVGGATIRIRDIATVRRGFVEPTNTIMHYNGRQAIGVSITNVSGSNVVDIGKRVDVRLEELIAGLPVGIEVNKIHWQSEIVDDAVNGFLINFAQALLIVIVVLTIGMGWRMSLLIGTALVVTIFASFILMALMKIDLQRMSLGALIIALGMMVDNAIVVADGFVVKLKQGVNKKTAAIQAAQIPSMPLLGATFIAVLAFYPIFASEEDAGEYCATLFIVVAISLLSSWVVSVTITPLQCMGMIKAPENASAEEDLYSGKFYRIFRAFLLKMMKLKYLVVVAMLGALVVSGIGFTHVKQLFFPNSSMTKFMVDYWAPEGTRIETVIADLRKAEEKILGDDHVLNVSSYIGSGPPRFYLPVEPEPLYKSYAQLIVNVDDFKLIPDYSKKLDNWFRDNYPQAKVSIRAFGVGPSDAWKFELRLSGPADAKAEDLRNISHQYEAIIENSPYAATVRTNWREMVPEIVPQFNQDKGGWVNISRADLANSTKLAFDGQSLGLFREKDELIPIIIRPVAKDRQNVGGLDVLPVTSSQSINSAPLSQVTDGIKLRWENPLRWRRDRVSTITIQSNPIPGVTLPTFRADVLADIEAVKLPPGYKIVWGGEFESSTDSQASLIPGIVPAVTLMILVIVMLFNAYRPPLIIFLTLPFAVIGMTIGLLVFDTPFGFLALLGGMSLSGMMIKNAIVLLDQAVIEFESGKDRHTAIVDAALSRLSPVFLAAATTVLGVVPLLQDTFWVGLAVTVMAGLTFGTFLTMVLVPVLYSIFYKPVRKVEEQIGDVAQATS